MGGLVTYDSSDEEDDVHAPTQAQISTQQQDGQDTEMSNGSVSETSKQPTLSAAEPSHISPPASPPQPQQQQQQSIPGPALGPILGPSLGPSLPEPSLSPSAFPDPDERPKSPYTANRDLVYSLTLPTFPNTSIPPSPPGSPPAALTAKFDSFLSLKSNPQNPIHFNARLAASAAVKNPGLMDKLMGFVGVELSFEDGKGREQYRTTLGPDGGWDPDAFPEWAFQPGLRRAGQRAAKERERKAGGRVEFVSAGGGDGVVAVGGVGVPPPVTGKRKTRFDE